MTRRGANGITVRALIAASRLIKGNGAERRTALLRPGGKDGQTKGRGSLRNHGNCGALTGKNVNISGPAGYPIDLLSRA